MEGRTLPPGPRALTLLASVFERADDGAAGRADRFDRGHHRSGVRHGQIARDRATSDWRSSKEVSKALTSGVSGDVGPGGRRAVPDAQFPRTARETPSDTTAAVPTTAAVRASAWVRRLRGVATVRRTASGMLRLLRLRPRGHRSGPAPDPASRDAYRRSGVPRTRRRGHLFSQTRSAAELQAPSPRPGDDILLAQHVRDVDLEASDLTGDCLRRCHRLEPPRSCHQHPS